jgi:hypothetical protein
MSKRDFRSGGLESMDAILASDRFIEQLRVSGTYEPSTRQDAALAAALLALRDDARQDPLSPPPRVDKVTVPDAADLPVPFRQPRRIARRSVAVAGVMLAMSSAAATAFDRDPLTPVRYLVDIGVTVGERISTPDGDSSSEEIPQETISGEESGDGTGNDLTPLDLSDQPDLTDPKDKDADPSKPGAVEPSDAGDPAEEPADDTAEETPPVDEDPVDEDPVDEEPVDEEPVDEQPPPTEEPPEEPVDEQPPEEEPDTDPSPPEDPGTDTTGEDPDGGEQPTSGSDNPPAADDAANDGGDAADTGEPAEGDTGDGGGSDADDAPPTTDEQPGSDQSTDPSGPPPPEWWPWSAAMWDQAYDWVNVKMELPDGAHLYQ